MFGTHLAPSTNDSNGVASYGEPHKMHDDSAGDGNSVHHHGQDDGVAVLGDR